MNRGLCNARADLSLPLSPHFPDCSPFSSLGDSPLSQEDFACYSLKRQQRGEWGLPQQQESGEEVPCPLSLDPLWFVTVPGHKLGLHQERRPASQQLAAAACDASAWG